MWGRSLAFVVIAGCTAEQPKAVTLPRQQPSVPAATTTPVSLLPPSERAGPNDRACLMLYECGCNAGCMSIDHAPSSLREGLAVTVTSGSLKGDKVFVRKIPTGTTEVFTIQRADPKSPFMICEAPRSSAIGYLCAGGSGPPRDCETCE